MTVLDGGSHSADRRTLIRQTVAGGLTAGAAAMIGRSVVAQDASPAASPVASTIVSPSREDVESAIEQAFPMTSAATVGGQVIMASTAGIASTHPHVYGDVNGSLVIGPIFSALFGFSPVDGSVIPDLADSWTMSGDGRVYTFALNPDATFHDGTPVTSADVVFSYDSALDERGPFLSRDGLTQVIQGYRAIDTHTFEITARQPSSLFYNKTSVAILPMHIWQDIPVESWATSAGSTGTDASMVIGSGAFRFVEHVPNDHVTIARYDDYWIPNLVPTIDTFTLRVIPEAAASVQALTVGEIDISLVPTPQADTLQASSDAVVVTAYDTWGFTYLIPNIDPEKGTFFSDLSTRQAVYYALDRQAMLDSVLFGYGDIAHGPQPPLSPAYAPDDVATKYDYDVEKAKALLEEAGWVDSDVDGVRERDGIVFSIRLVYYDLDETTTQALTYVQQALGEIGITVELVPVLDTIIDAFTNMDFDLSYTTIFWASDGDQGALFRCGSFFPNGFNFSRWCNEEYDALDDRQLVELDRPARIEILKQMTDIANDDVPSIYLYYPQEIVGSRTRLQNFHPTGYGTLWSLGRVWIDESN